MWQEKHRHIFAVLLHIRLVHNKIKQLNYLCPTYSEK